MYVPKSNREEGQTLWDIVPKRGSMLLRAGSRNGKAAIDPIERTYPLKARSVAAIVGNGGEERKSAALALRRIIRIRYRKRWSSNPSTVRTRFGRRRPQFLRSWGS